jgi:hypothetical protein
MLPTISLVAARTGRRSDRWVFLHLRKQQDPGSANGHPCRCKICDGVVPGQRGCRSLLARRLVACRVRNTASPFPFPRWELPITSSRESSRQQTVDVWSTQSRACDLEKKKRRDRTACRGLPWFFLSESHPSSVISTPWLVPPLGSF